MQYKPGDIVYIVANTRFIKTMEILNISYGVVTLRSLDHKGGMKLRVNRLFPTKEAAEEYVANINKKHEEDAARQAQRMNDPHTV